MQDRIDALGLPAGMEYGGLFQQFEESFRSLYVGIAAAAAIVYIAMAIIMGRSGPRS